MIARLAWIGGAVLAALAALALAVLAVLAWQGRRPPEGSAPYVALGSSYAAGVGLGRLAPGAPVVCARTTNGYPGQLARELDLRLVDMTCSGSTTRHILSGGQAFQGPQLAAVGPGTRLVTVTSGGNDVGYIGGLLGATRHRSALVRLLASPPRPVAQSDFALVSVNLEAIVAAIRRRAPDATVVLVSYPAVLPPHGTCAGLDINADAADQGRAVAARLHDATQAAARRSGALFVDMEPLGAGHDACSGQPWINGAHPRAGFAFHPNAEGAKATAQAVARALSVAASPSGRS